MRFFANIVLVLGVAACAPILPNSGVGVGAPERAAVRSEQTRGKMAPPINGEIVPPGQDVQTAGTIAQTVPDTNTAAISDTQDFSAVISRQTIQSDKEHLAALRKEYRVIAPTALPPRPKSVGPNIVEFALSTTNKVGEPLYRRSAFLASSRYIRNCSKYTSPDKAQEAFLRRGGPKRNPGGLDPDGDGFACTWDPQPFRNARK